MADCDCIEQLAFLVQKHGLGNCCFLLLSTQLARNLTCGAVSSECVIYSITSLFRAAILFIAHATVARAVT